jgi:hypothetical protein
MEKISKETAVQLGLKRFFTGVPCFRGHICERYVVSSNACVECVRFTKRKQRERDPERARLCGQYDYARSLERKARERQRQARERGAKEMETRRAAAEMENGPIS